MTETGCLQATGLVLFFSHGTRKAVWIILSGFQHGSGDFYAKWDRVLNYLEQMERKLDCCDKNGKFQRRWIKRSPLYSKLVPPPPRPCAQHTAKILHNLS